MDGIVSRRCLLMETWADLQLLTGSSHCHLGNSLPRIHYSQKRAVKGNGAPTMAAINSMTPHIQILNGKKWTRSLTRNHSFVMEALIKWKGLKNLQ